MFDVFPTYFLECADNFANSFRDLDLVITQTADVLVSKSADWRVGYVSLQWHHNEHHGVSNHQSHDWSTVYLDADQRTHQRSAPLAFVRGIHRWPVNSLHKGQITRKMFPFDDVIMFFNYLSGYKRFRSPSWAGWRRRYFESLQGLTFCDLVTPYGDTNLGQHWFR